MRIGFQKCILLILVSISPLMTTLVLPTKAEAVQATFLYKLSSITGPFMIAGGGMFVDKERNEVYIVYQNITWVFNKNGLEIYRFNEDNSLGRLSSLSVDQDGTIFFLSYDDRGAYVIIQCNYRGEQTGRIEVTGLPTDFSGFENFSPTHMEYRQGQFYLADARTLRIAVADMNGKVQKTYDLMPLLKLKEKNRRDYELGGFSVDKEGDMLFTVPVMFRAGILSPDGKLTNFGQGGDAAGKFGIVSGIVKDNKGNYLVADKLHCVISVFDRNNKFLMEFGGPGDGPSNLITPDALAVDGGDKVFVTQGGNRGVSVFKLDYD